MVDDAEFVLGLSMKLPGFNRYQTTLQSLRSRKIKNLDKLYPPPMDPKTQQPLPDYPSPPDPKMLEVQVKQQAGQLAAQKLQFDIQTQQTELQAEMQLNQAKIVELHAKATLEMAEAQATQQGHAVGAMQVQLQAAELRQKQMQARSDQLQTAQTNVTTMLNDSQQRAHERDENTKARRHELNMATLDHAHDRSMANAESSSND
jgi:biopolymer transport protein ExbD